MHLCERWRDLGAEKGMNDDDDGDDGGDGDFGREFNILLLFFFFFFFFFFFLYFELGFESYCFTRGL